jgi:hypothetical protein
MGADLQSTSLGHSDTSFKTGHIVPPVNPAEGFIVGRLETVFNPNQVVLLIGTQEIQGIHIHTIRPRADGQTHHTFVCQGLVVKGLEPREGRIGIGKGLKIGNEAPCLEPPSNKTLGINDLLLYR